MEITERLEVPCAPAELFPHVVDLDRYPFVDATRPRR